MGNMQMNQQQMMQPPQQAPQPQMAPQPQQPQMTIDQRYLYSCHQMLPAIVAENPNYRTQVGTIFYEYIDQLIGADKAPKVTGMLIDLPIEDIKLIMQDFSLLQTRVQQASELIAQQPAN